VALYIPKEYLRIYLPFFMRYRDSDLIPSTLQWFFVPQTNCPLYAFTKWSLRSVNNTVEVNYFPLLNATAAFGSGTGTRGALSVDTVTQVTAL
jgi:hypothetical protein